MPFFRPNVVARRHAMILPLSLLLYTYKLLPLEKIFTRRISIIHEGMINPSGDKSCRYASSERSNSPIVATTLNFLASDVLRCKTPVF